MGQWITSWDTKPFVPIDPIGSKVVVTKCHCYLPAAWQSMLKGVCGLPLLPEEAPSYLAPILARSREAKDCVGHQGQTTLSSKAGPRHISRAGWRSLAAVHAASTVSQRTSFFRASPLADCISTQIDVRYPCI